MSVPLLVASVLIFLLGLIHSVLGELLILRPMKQVTGFPPILGSLELPKQTVWIVWHILTVFAWVLALIVGHAASQAALGEGDRFALRTIAVACVISAGFGVVGTRARHASWVAFLAIAILCWVGAR